MFKTIVGAFIRERERERAKNSLVMYHLIREIPNNCDKLQRLKLYSTVSQERLCNAKYIATLSTGLKCVMNNCLTIASVCVLNVQWSAVKSQA